MLEVAVSNAQRMNVSNRVKILNGDMSNTSLPDESFDFVMCHLALCHVKEPMPTLREFHRLLRNNGVLSLIVENREFFSLRHAFLGNLVQALKNQMKDKLEIELLELGTIKTFSRDEILSMLAETNLKPVKIMGLRIVSDYLYYQNRETPNDLESLKQLETLLSVDETWNRIGRFHFIFSQK
jgi:ubiquinone/menaquinone biosynthesis C-methylase UbiE